MAARPWKLSPSDFAFLWEECKRCFYLKVALGFRRPGPIMPRIFSLIDSQMKACFGGERTERIALGLPGGVVEFGERWVESRPIAVPGRSSACFVRGRFDTVARFDDGTYGVIDFKTSERKAEHLPLYARQLHAYAHALENPAPGSFGLRPIGRIGLLVFEPSVFHNHGESRASLGGGMSWIELPRDDAAFREFLSEVLALLERGSPPDGSPSCEWCQYRESSRRTPF